MPGPLVISEAVLFKESMHSVEDYVWQAADDVCRGNAGVAQDPPVSQRPRKRCLRRGCRVEQVKDQKLA